MTVEILQGDCLEVLRTLPAESVHCCVTSPPYWGLRDYGCDGQLGSERTPDEYLAVMTNVFSEVRRVLRDDGTLWLNIGDSYAQDKKWGGTTGGKHAKGLHGTNGIGRNRTNTGLPSKNLVGIPWRLALALQADGWRLRNDIIWSKPNPMPESVSDRCTRSHEYIFLMSKSEQYYYNQEAVLEPVSPNTHARLAQDVEAQIGSERAHAGWKTNGNMKAVGRRKMAEVGSGVNNNESFNAAACLRVEERNTRTIWDVEDHNSLLDWLLESHPEIAEEYLAPIQRDVWTVTTQPYKGAHFATFPQKLITPCILAGCPEGGTVLDPFFGSGTTGKVAQKNGCNCIGIELNPEYVKLAKRRTQQGSLL